ncbi:MAG: methyl-accepting chemotaxis protein [Sulfuricurvum sp.]|uniref:methyl-accepting chemotaxis protein n=1 Tax=Sulfuricurvum sp. TaxID=2025608 RepID=UPI00273636F7|nr:methyl-accepting chemotaxis protein [Sulfuricurvum sp.]MDP3291134.1 methyl-accepting chemotaxis protein [Sulfuricurvum sp.]
MLDNLTIKQKLRLIPISAIFLMIISAVVFAIYPRFALVTFIGTIGLLLIFARTISWTILKSINELHKGFEIINSSSNTEHRLDINGNDEIVEVSKLFNTYMEKLDTIAIKDKEAIEDIANVAKMMAVGFVSVRIKSEAGSPGLQQAVEGFNTALGEMEKATIEISRVMSALGTSNYAVEFETGKYSGELGGMMTSLQGLSESVGDFMALLSINGLALNQGASTLSNASNDLSASSNTQASSLEETAAAIEELTSNIAANSQKATEMASLARETQTAANDGKALADTTVSAMHEISRATQSINDAVNIIENIAFQTNILSLNAAVEAATAGDAGKGFAVVAQEVRNLANRSADAAQQIKLLAELANTKSTDGLQVSENMMKGLDVINQKIMMTTQLVQDVANGSREQMAGINQINSAVAQLDQMTQQNASLANDVSHLSEDILGMSQSLSDTAAKTKYRKESENRVCRIDMMFETNKLKFDHVNFKNNNFGKLKESVSAWTVTNETQCDLGKWIQAHNNESYAKGPEWKDLLTHHAHVHQKVQEFINREKSGGRPEELERIAKEIETDTTKVFASLNKVRVAACMEDQQIIPTKNVHTHAPRHIAIVSKQSTFSTPKSSFKKDDTIWENF